MSPTGLADRPPSAMTLRAAAFLDERRPAAERLGRDLADLVGDPDAFLAAIVAGLRGLADPEYVTGQQRVAPGIGPVIGVRQPLLRAVERGFRAETRDDRSVVPALFVADRLLRAEFLEPRWFAMAMLGHLIEADPERSWQLVRRAAHEAGDWITVDTLGQVAATGILAESYRWAELEQLVYSPITWERRLVGSTIATIPFADRGPGRTPEVAERGLAIIGQLIGDAEPDVQKALAWALRSLVQADAAAVAAFCETEAARAAADDDGGRAWVIRDTLPKLDTALAQRLRDQLERIRRRPGATSTSTAARTAEQFASMGLGRDAPVPPLT